jgi:hypothetical protein
MRVPPKIDSRVLNILNVIRIIIIFAIMEMIEIIIVEKRAQDLPFKSPYAITK